jgi:hypothetical protein
VLVALAVQLAFAELGAPGVKQRVPRARRLGEVIDAAAHQR